MRILFLSRYQNTTERGAEVFVSELSKRLSKNHTVDIFSGSKADSIREVIKGKFDIVIPINGRLQSLKVSLARILGSYKLLITGHSGRGWDDILNILIKPDVFVALTEPLKNWARKYAWGSMVVKISNGVDVKRFTPVGEKIKINLPRPIILSVGALVWYKHHEKIIDALSFMNTGSLLIVGEGPLKMDLIKKAEEKLPGRFMITSFKNEDMPRVYRSVDLFSLPSWDREAFGIAYLEALASGLGVVAPDDLSRKEIIGEAGVLVDTEDLTVYAKAIESALNIDWKKKASMQAEKFSWDDIAKEYEKVMLVMIKSK